jgi:hypothetical protein
LCFFVFFFSFEITSSFPNQLVLRETEERDRQEQYFLELKKIEDREVALIRLEREAAEKGREKEFMSQLEKARELQEEIEREKGIREREAAEQLEREQREREQREEREREQREEREREQHREAEMEQHREAERARLAKEMEREREDREKEERKEMERREMERLLRAEEEREEREREERERDSQSEEKVEPKPEPQARHAERIPNTVARDLAGTMSNPMPALDRTDALERNQARNARRCMSCLRVVSVCFFIYFCVLFWLLFPICSFLTSRSSGWTIRADMIGAADSLMEGDTSLSSPRLVKARSIREKIGSAVPLKLGACRVCSLQKFLLLFYYF